MWIFSLLFGGNRVQTFIFALFTTMFLVDRHSVKYAIHTKDHTQSMYDVLLGYHTNYRCLWTGPEIVVHTIYIYLV
jgi:hypothetical protein